MSRGSSAVRRVIHPDPIYKSELVAKFTNVIMERGKKTVAQEIVYGAMEFLKNKKEGEALALFEAAIEKVRPQVEVRSRRVGGANYQVPMPVAPQRQNALAFRWIKIAAQARGGRSMIEKLGAELVDILNETGAALKRKEEVHRMAEANKAFAHFARFSR